MNNIESFLSPIEQFGIRQGDVLFVSSDIRNVFFYYMEQYNEMLSLDDIIIYFQKLVGEQGTLIFPTYNWDFCRGVCWNYYKTKNETGSLGTIALQRKEFRRTQHPIYSFAVWGKGQDELCRMQNKSAFGADSPFAWLDVNMAKNLMIDVTCSQCLTFVHYVEQKSGVVKYRYEKDFTAGYTDADGKYSIKTYSMFVRDLALDVDVNFDKLESQLLHDGIAKRIYADSIPFMMLDMHRAVEPIMNDIIYNKSRNLCTYIGQ